MGDGYQFIDIVLFALVAGFLVLRLRSVLGRRDGHQTRAPDPFAPHPKAEHADDTVVRLPERNGRPLDTAAPPPLGVTPGMAGNALQAALAQIKIADHRFEADEFTSGACVAFELILKAFATGDSETLKPLLSPEVFGNFARSMRERQAKGQRLETKLVALKSSAPVEAYMAGRTAHVTVKFVSEQVSALYDSAGSIIEGDPNAVIEVTDFWTFARDTRSPDPNWTLVATASSD